MKKIVLSLFVAAATITGVIVISKTAGAKEATSCQGQACGDLDETQELGRAFGGNTWFTMYENRNSRRTIRLTYRQQASFNSCMNASTLDIPPGQKKGILAQHCLPVQADYIN